MSSDRIIQLGHGSGGILQNELIQFITKSIIDRQCSDGVGLDAFDDGATIPLHEFSNPSELEIVVTADGHTIDPLIFPGGDLGSLAICGTVNDLLMMGAKPLALTSVVIIEEGTTFNDVGRIMESFNQTAAENKIAIIAGDTKIMPRDSLKGMIISTTGIGIRPQARKILDSNCQVGSKIILTGSIGDHGAALIAYREKIKIDPPLNSDVSALLPLLPIIERTASIFAMKDPTRGGIAAALNEWAQKSHVGIHIEEKAISIRREVQALADILGLDPFEIANEGKALLCVAAQEADSILAQIKTTQIGAHATIIGEICQEHPGRVVLSTLVGGTRIIEPPMGELIPRIC